MRAFGAKYRRGLIAAVAVAALYVVFFALGVGCPIKYLTGISCPGCGMTRACLSALRLDFSAALYYHPLWMALPPFAVACVLLRWRRKPRALRALVFGGAALMLAVWVWRVFAHEGDVVVIAPQSGLMVRVARRILGVFPK